VDTLFDLAGRIAVITGGMGQLGIEYSAALFERGCRVIILDQTSDPKVTNELFNTGIKKGKIKQLLVDICDPIVVKKASSAIKSEFGAPSILINNAALDSPPNAPAEEVGPFEKYPISSFERVMDVNVKGTLICSQVFGAQMAENHCGSIINIASIYGMLSPCQDIYEFRRKNGETYFKPVAYSVSKSAIFNLTRYMATYWGKKNVRVNTISPAGVFNEQPIEFLEAYCKKVPMGRMAKAEELVGAIIFLSSDASSYITGTNLVIDGGWSAW